MLTGVGMFLVCMGVTEKEILNAPGFAVKGHPMASCTVRMVFVSRCETR